MSLLVAGPASWVFPLDMRFGCCHVYGCVLGSFVAWCPQIQPIVSAAVYDNKLITGAATGHLYIWIDRAVSRAVQGTRYPTTVCAVRWVGGGGVGRGGVVAIGNEGHCHAISSREVQINVIFVFGWDSLVYSSPPTTPLQRTRRR